MKREYCLGNILKVQKIDELLVDSEGKKDIQELMLKTDKLYAMISKKKTKTQFFYKKSFHVII